MDGQVSPLFAVAGRFLTITENKQWERVLRNPAFWPTFVSIAAVYATISMQAVVMTAQKDIQLLLWVLPLIASCTWLVLFFLFRIRRRIREEREARLTDVWYDAKAVRAGTMISFYRDHIAYTTMRGSCQIRYMDITLCCETADGFALGNERFCVYVRSADLTKGEVSRIRGWLLQAISPSFYRQKAPAEAQLTDPLPTVRFANYDQIQTRAEATRKKDHRAYGDFLGLVLPQMVVYGFTPAPVAPLTPWALLDFLLWPLIFCAVGFLAALLFWRLTLAKPQPSVPVVFTKDGLACRQEGVFSFVVNTRYAVKTTEDGLTLRFSSGEEWDIPWSAIENVDALNLPQKGEQTNG
jgi:hypothetical protein